MNRETVAGDPTEPAWFKSSYSSGGDEPDCVEVAVAWFKSSYSDGGSEPDCVEIAHTPGTVHIRDSKNTRAPHLTVSGATWVGFLAGQPWDSVRSLA
ncbi:DUF397 domain-containing protein [Streptomyces sp. SID14478]|uniref:DUF397 domain-containing protein n=1 Tax=Streptomyces sp. SID14478 TaxID=2706073 RepID=UPI0013DACFA2|nr:DUF397 domain-containing protein [Streptomyces sp. SID14478]NEB75506.1 DUF397 domain-containing protein [Streptomyces sp. SID14478]